jgi:mono/diheme cytochrome c family protein
MVFLVPFPTTKVLSRKTGSDQLLKYFPGKLEVIGVVVLPTILIVLLFLLPYLDRKPERHFRRRMGVTVATGSIMLAVVVLTTLSILEAPPPSVEAGGDSTAALYAQNCTGCHGPVMNIPTSTNLHEIIAQGSHEDMPAWSGDLTNEQIDALVGFILSPQGNDLYNSNCAECHEVTSLVASNPLELVGALENGTLFEGHAELEEISWLDLTAEESAALLNFLVAPDGQRLFATNCSACHGYSLSFSGGEEGLSATIREGGLHLEMPAWQEKLDTAELDLLAQYVVDPGQAPEGGALYQANCSSCHFTRIPEPDSYETALAIITTGGAHETMPVWGDILTDEQIDALTAYTIQAIEGTSSDVGQQLFLQNCTSCHGTFGEGGPNPSRTGDIIAPISTAEYLRTRDDVTLRAIIEQGQPEFGMSPFGLSYGGALDTEEVDALVAYIRAWQADPPVESPPDVDVSAVSGSGGELYQGVCAQCHGVNASGGVGPSLRSDVFREGTTRDEIYASVSDGHSATPMIAWGEILSAQQIYELTDFILSLPASDGTAEGEVSFAVSILPVFDTYCLACHSEGAAQGGWVSTSHDSVINSGDNGPAVFPGDVEKSFLAQKIQDTQTVGLQMPPGQAMPQEIIDLVLEWISAGALDN